MARCPRYVVVSEGRYRNTSDRHHTTQRKMNSKFGFGQKSGATSLSALQKNQNTRSTPVSMPQSAAPVHTAPNIQYTTKEMVDMYNPNSAPIPELEEKLKEHDLEATAESSMGGIAVKSLEKAMRDRKKRAEQSVRAPGNDGSRSVFGTSSQPIGGDDSPHSNRRGGDVAALVVSENAFKAQRTNELDEAQKLAKTVNGILNKLTPEKYDALAHQLCDPALQILVKKEYMHKTIELIFARAVTQVSFCMMYADLAALICGKEVELRESESEGRNKSMFRRLLLEVVQKEFEKRNDKDEDEDEESLKKKRLGNINFIGELYNKALLTDNVICMVIETLLFSSTPPEPRTAHRPAPEELEELIRLLTTIGRVLDHRAKKSSSERLNENKTKAFFTQIQALSCESMYKMRIKIMLVNTIDLRSQGWPQKVQTAKKLNELEKENEEKDRRKYVSSELFLQRKADAGAFLGTVLFSHPNITFRKHCFFVFIRFLFFSLTPVCCE